MHVMIGNEFEFDGEIIENIRYIRQIKPRNVGNEKLL